ncbi:hypothetical protein Tco_0235798, partial [Tanacetum coccineum]
HGYAVSSLMDTAYWLSGSLIFKISSFKLQNARLLLIFTKGGGMAGSSSMGVLTAEEDTTVTTTDIDEAPAVETSKTTDLGEGKAAAIVEDVTAPAVDKGKAKESVADETSTQKG